MTYINGDIYSMNYDIVASQETKPKFLSTTKRLRAYGEVIVRKQLPFAEQAHASYTFEVNVLFERRVRFLWMNFWVVCKALRLPNCKFNAGNVYNGSRCFKMIDAAKEVYFNSKGEFPFNDPCNREFVGWDDVMVDVNSEVNEMLVKYWHSTGEYERRDNICNTCTSL